MASYLLPSSFQKRFLRYALSKLELLDTDALDLERLDIAWGKRSTVELKDVGLHLTKLASLICLPPTLELTHARIVLLKVTVPTDIYHSPIVLEVHGVDIKLKLVPDDVSSKSFQKGQAPSSSGSDPALPAPGDLAKSFLQSEPSQGKAELEAAIGSQSVSMSTTSSSSDPDDDFVEGMGGAYTLPGFLADFLQGVSDRLQISVRNVQVNVDMNLPPDASIEERGEVPPDSITLRLAVQELVLKGHGDKAEATADEPDPGNGEEGQKSAKTADRNISLHNVSGWLISDASIFSHLEKSSVSSSPKSRHAKSSRGRTYERQHISSSSPGVASSSSGSDSYDSDNPMLQSTILDGSKHSSAPLDDDARFADASDEERSYASSLQDSQELLHSGSSSILANSTAFHTPVPIDQFSDALASSTESLDSLPTFSTSAATRPSQPHFENLLRSTSKIAVRSPGAASSSQFYTSSRVSPPQSISPNIAAPTLSSSLQRQSHAFGDHGPATPRALEPIPPPAELPPPEEFDELAESRLFTHEEAESMYLSAMSGASSHKSSQQSKSSEGFQMPGGWGLSDSDEERRLKASISTDGEEVKEGLRGGMANSLSLAGDSSNETVTDPTDGEETDSENLKRSESEASVVVDEILSDSVRHITESPPKSHSGADADTRLAKCLLFVDKVDIVIPGIAKETVDPTPNEIKTKVANLPGAFSTTIDASVSDSFFGSVMQDRPTSAGQMASMRLPSDGTDKTSSADDGLDPIQVGIGSLQGQIDISIGFLIIRILQQANRIFKEQAAANPGDSMPNPPKSAFSLNVGSTSLKLLELLRAAKFPSQDSASTPLDFIGSPGSDILLQTVIEDLALSSFTDAVISKLQVGVGKFVLGYDEDPIICFEKINRIKSSVQHVRAAAEDDFAISSSKIGLVHRVIFQSRPIRVSLDLQRLDETFAWFGGFSSILGMKSSVTSVATVKGGTKPTMQSVQPTRGVRFESEPTVEKREPVASSETKLDIKTGGFDFDLNGRDCVIRASTSAVKVVSRAEGIGVQIDKINIDGPILRHVRTPPPVQIDIENARIEYLGAPKESDLSRLLALLTPSNNKYDQEDDILVDTLLRQRRKGPVLRTGIGSFHCSVNSLDSFDSLSSLGDELAKLATVTKYLPEDDRPGLLSLLLVKDLNLKVALGHSLGNLTVAGKNLDVAHVSVPALVAVGLDTISAQCDAIPDDMIGEAIPTDGVTTQQVTPMIIARMIGDEMEPTIKIKLWNLRLEYRVPFVKALLDIKDNMTTEEAIADLAMTVATLTRPDSRPSTPRPSSSGTVSQSRSESKMRSLKFDIIMRDCIIGLNPLKSPAKGLVVFTDARFTTALPKDEQTQANFDIGNASFLVIDDVDNMLSFDEVTANPSRKRRSISYLSGQISDLCASGFVSVSNVRSAKAILKIVDGGVDQSNYIDVELKDQLLVLESCADSTQTMVAIFSGLAPPTPPSTDIKYRTQIVPVQDMLASLSGDAFSSAQDDEYVEQFPSSLEDDDMVEDDVPRNPEFVSSFYGGGLDVSSTSKGTSDGGDSFMTQPPPAKAVKSPQKTMLDSFQEQSTVHSDEPLDFREDHFGTGSQMPGKAQRWDSVKNAYGQKNEYEVAGSPLKVRIRDIHIIWNLFDGYDWQKTRDKISKAVHEVEVKAMERRRRSGGRPAYDQIEEEDQVIGDFLFNSIYIGIPANRDPRELANAINHNVDDLASEAESYAATTITQTTVRASSHTRGRGKRLKLNRSKHHKLTFEIKGLAADLVVFPPESGETQSSLDLRIRDFEIFDHVPTSSWKKFATYMHDAGEREMGSNMVHLELLTVKPVPDLAASEIVVRVSILPLRLHVDQDALDFMTRFFEFKDDSTPVSDAPGEMPFLQRVEINSIPVMLDYKPKKVDYAGLRSGHTTEFMNFFILDAANMTLRHVIIYGTSGLDKLSRTLNDIWMPDVRQNQLPGILAGLTPIRPLVNVGAGVRDLVAVPIREYRKDGRVVRSIRKGTLAFAKTTTTELVKLGAKLAIGTQTVLQGAEGLLSPSAPSAESADPSNAGWEDAALDSSEDDEPERNTVISPYADQPIGVMQGLRGAYATLERDLLTARDAIVAVPGEVMESETATGAAKAVLKRAPTIIFRPAIGASKAIGQTMLGAANSLDPQERRRTSDIMADLREKKSISKSMGAKLLHRPALSTEPFEDFDIRHTKPALAQNASDFSRHTYILILEPKWTPKPINTFNSTINLTLQTLPYLFHAGLEDTQSRSPIAYSYFLPRSTSPIAESIFQRFAEISSGASGPRITFSCAATARCLERGPQGQHMNGYSTEIVPRSRYGLFTYTVNICPDTLRRAETWLASTPPPMPASSPPEPNPSPPNPLTQNPSFLRQFCNPSPGWFDAVPAFHIVHEMMHFLSLTEKLDIRDDVGYGLQRCLRANRRGGANAELNAQNWAFVVGYAVRQRLWMEGRCGRLIGWGAGAWAWGGGGILGRDVRGVARGGELRRLLGVRDGG
ncbi:MAG: autophagy- protein 2 [Vezdaea aestivalis]|nr:MAG: autophagy- protein 2 [Vezdaea aestivalis]